MKFHRTLFCFMLCAFAPLAAEVVTPEIQIQKQGKEILAVVKLDIEKGWHAYWKNPGEAGFPTEVEWSLPEGWSIGDVQWPTPERLVVQELVNYGFHDELLILSELVPPSSYQGEEVNLTAEVKWLVCSNDTCLPGNQEISVTIPASDQVAPKAQEAKKLLPKKLSNVEATRKGGQIVLSLQGAELSSGEMHFYPEDAELLGEQIEQKASRSVAVTLLDQETKDFVVRGVALFKDASGKTVSAYAVEAPVEADMPEGELALVEEFSVATGQDSFEGGFFWALIFAFMGGAILNLMPCVLPVISLKIFSFVKMAGEDRKKIMRHGLLFTLGVLVSFWSLAGVLIALQASGAAVGWGFQLQDPLFVGVLTALIFVFALSLFGLFEFGTMFSSWAGQKQSDMGQKSGGGSSAFFSGVLATAVATPCTGPFLGPAIGFAMTLSPLGAQGIFTALALGMASPYLVISFFPSLIRFLPKPGAWMVTFKEILGFCMAATALWLIWVFSAQTSSMAASTLLAALFLLSIGSWVYGKWASPMKKRFVRTVGRLLTLSLFLGGFFLIYRASEMQEVQQELVAMADPAAETKDIRAWEPFNKERLEYLRSQGTPVLIDFTARWCLICQANHMVLTTSEVEEKLAEAGVVKMLADWTKNDPEITAELKKFGRSGVPLYLVYGKESEPVILPQVLSPDLVIENVESAL